MVSSLAMLCTDSSGSYYLQKEVELVHPSLPFQVLLFLTGSEPIIRFQVLYIAPGDID